MAPVSRPPRRRGAADPRRARKGKRPGAGGPPLPARGPHGEAEEDGEQTGKLCPSPQDSSPRTCSPVLPVPARGGGTRGEGCGGGAPGERGGAARTPPPLKLRAGAVTATAGRGRQHGGVSGGVGASQQQRRRWQRPELWPPAEGGGLCETRQHPRGGLASGSQPRRSARRGSEAICEEIREASAEADREIGGKTAAAGCEETSEETSGATLEAVPGGERQGAPHGRRARLRRGPERARRRGAGGCWGCEAPAGGRGPRRG